MTGAPAAPEASGPDETAPAAPERAVAFDMVRRSVFFAVPLVVGAAVGWGWSGVASAGLALALVLANLLLGAAAITWGARLGPNAMMAAVLGGYVVRLGIVTAVVLPVRHHGWFDVLPFAVSLLLTHLGLLIVEARHISASAAFPGLKPGHEFPSRRGSSQPLPFSSLERSA